MTDNDSDDDDDVKPSFNAFSGNFQNMQVFSCRVIILYEYTFTFKSIWVGLISSKMEVHASSFHG